MCLTRPAGRYDQPVDKVDHLNPEQLPVQLARIIRRAVESGELAPRQKLPSESVLADHHGVSRVTVRTALTAIKDEGLIVSVAGRGWYVADVSKPWT